MKLVFGSVVSWFVKGLANNKTLFPLEPIGGEISLTIISPVFVSSKVSFWRLKSNKCERLGSMCLSFQ